MEMIEVEDDVDTNEEVINLIMETEEEGTSKFEKFHSSNPLFCTDELGSMSHPVQCLLETMLSVPTTEAVYQRWYDQAALGT